MGSFVLGFLGLSLGLVVAIATLTVVGEWLVRVLDVFLARRVGKVVFSVVAGALVVWYLSALSVPVASILRRKFHV